MAEAAPGDEVVPGAAIGPLAFRRRRLAGFAARVLDSLPTRHDLGIDSIGWGWVTGIFTLAYCLFEVPTGMLGDRIGPRRVLPRIVVWWSGFTALTGAMTGLYPLLLTRFLFGVGDASREVGDDPLTRLIDVAERKLAAMG